MSDDQPARPTLPGAVLRRELESRGWTQKDLAEILGRPAQVITEIIRGSKQITPDTALELGAALGTPADVWTNLETAYRLQVARSRYAGGPAIARRAKVFERLPITEMVKRGWIRGSKDVDELDQQAREFLGVSDLDQEPKLFVNCRRSTSAEDALAAQRAWVRRLEIVASQQKTKAKYNAEKLRSALPSIRLLAENEKDVTRVPALLNELGVRFVVVRPLPKTRIDGAALYGVDGPILGVSLRYDRIDWFWFTLMHELAHFVLQHDGSHLDFEVLQQRSEQDRDEVDADILAAESLLSERAFSEFVRTNRRLMSKDSIEQFARREKVHPGIVVGRLHFEDVVPYSHFRSYLVKVSDQLAAWNDTP